MTIKAEQDACGLTYDVSCDECGDTFLAGLDSEEAARRTLNSRHRGQSVRVGLPGQRVQWHNYCAACAHEMEET